MHGLHGDDKLCRPFWILNMTTINYIKQLADTTSRLKKEEILTHAYGAGERNLFIAVKYAYDYHISFGVGVKMIPNSSSELTEDLVSFDDFLILLENLRTRKVTGNAAIDAMTTFMNQCTYESWEILYKNILRKDLRAGISETTVNKVLKNFEDSNNYITSVFSCQLAKDAGDEKIARLHLNGKKLVDVKLDGVRLLTIIDKENNTVTQYTRTGKINENFTNIVSIFEEHLHMFPESVVLDGEVVSENFQKLMNSFNRQTDVDTTGITYHIFDAIPLKDFENDNCKVKEIDRIEKFIPQAFQVICALIDSKISILDKELIDLNDKQGYARFMEINQQAIDNGFEGIMLKDPNALYQRKRSFNWLKLKPYIEVSLEVVGFEIGKPGTSNENSLGALICKGNVDGKEVMVDVGSGFGVETITRDEIWNNQKNYLGYIAEVKADAITKSENGEFYSLRFPRFKGFRGNSPGELI